MEYDVSDAVSDLRDYSLNCRNLLQMENTLRYKRKEIDSLSLKSGNATISRDKNRTYQVDNHDRLFDLMEEFDQLQTQYAALRKQIRLISRTLALLKLTERQIRIITLRHECNQSFITIGRILRTDPITVFEELNEINRSFVEMYIKVCSASVRSRQAKTAMEHPEHRAPVSVLDALDMV